MSAGVRGVVKAIAHALATVAVIPSILSYAIRARVIGHDRALEGSTQAWAVVPGLPGQYLRRAFLARTLAGCARSATIEFGTIFSSANAMIGERAYLGPRCHVGWALIDSDVLVGAGVHIPSGLHTHGADDVATPIREQSGTKVPVRIGPGAWIGSTAVVMADVGAGTIVGAGAVVTRPIPDLVVAGGVPARILRPRDPRILQFKA
jgi:virginiamycin A acetyltransferase